MLNQAIGSGECVRLLGVFGQPKGLLNDLKRLSGIGEPLIVFTIEQEASLQKVGEFKLSYRPSYCSNSPQ